MNVLIVYAHPEPKSFNGAMRDLAVSTFIELGYKVKVSDLYEMKFKAIADQDDFWVLSNPSFFKYQIEQGKAYEKGSFSSDIVAEQEKILWADLIIFQSPLWWFSFPAILKGWFDRVFAVGFAYGGGRMYDTGVFREKKAMLAITTGSPASSYTPSGKNGDINQVLFHIQHGTLSFVGLSVLPPFIAWSPSRVEQEQREGYLEDYKQRLLTLETTPNLFFSTSQL